MLGDRIAIFVRMTYRLDKTAFAVLTHQEAEDQHVDIEGKMTMEERVQLCAYLTKVAYGYANQPWPPMDKTAFKIRKRR